MTEHPASPASSPPVYCIVLNWNGWRDTVECLKSLQASTYTNLSVFVVDNGSTDDSVARLRQACPQKACPQMELIETGENLGFAGGNNRGIQAALDRHAKYVWLLNNDTTVTPDTLKALVSAAEDDPRLGQIGSVLFYMNEPSRLQAWGGGKVNLWTGRSCHFNGPVPAEDLDYLTAASVLLPAEVFRKLGLLDQEYFMYWEDTDLSYRIRAAGWRLGVAPEAIVYHKESASTAGNSPKLDRYMTASGVRFLRRFARFPWLSIMVMILARAAKRFLFLQWQRGWAVIAGLSGYRRAETNR